LADEEHTGHERHKTADERDPRVDLREGQAGERVTRLFAGRSALEERAKQLLERSAERLERSQQVLDHGQTTLSRADERIALARATNPRARPTKELETSQNRRRGGHDPRSLHPAKGPEGDERSG
jgi:hypothetical protein